MSAKTEKPWQGVVWKTSEGEVLSCVEKLKVLHDNFREIEQLCQDAFEDALLMGCDERQIREALGRVIAQLRNPYQKPD
ncbi:MAG TPA: hypothetical protein VGB82_25590 [Alphaproteobacteria bacterium]